METMALLFFGISMAYFIDYLIPWSSPAAALGGSILNLLLGVVCYFWRSKT